MKANKMRALNNALRREVGLQACGPFVDLHYTTLHYTGMQIYVDQAHSGAGTHLHWGGLGLGSDTNKVIIQRLLKRWRGESSSQLCCLHSRDLLLGLCKLKGKVRSLKTEQAGLTNNRGAHPSP